MAFFVSFSLGSEPEEAVVVGGAVVVVSLILKNYVSEKILGTRRSASFEISFPVSGFRNPQFILSHSLGDRLGAGNVDILFAVSGNRTVR